VAAVVAFAGGASGDQMSEGIFLLIWKPPRKENVIYKKTTVQQAAFVWFKQDSKF
jgi:hypothetical protein